MVLPPLSLTAVGAPGVALGAYIVPNASPYDGKCPLFVAVPTVAVMLFTPNSIAARNLAPGRRNGSKGAIGRGTAAKAPFDQGATRSLSSGEAHASSTSTTDRRCRRDAFLRHRGHRAGAGQEPRQGARQGAHRSRAARRAPS